MAGEHELALLVVDHDSHQHMALSAFLLEFLNLKGGVDRVSNVGVLAKFAGDSFETRD